jgi:tetratricopeptide (TPR) repeat protein
VCLLGRGGEGRVDLVLDHAREEVVARKRVSSRDPASLLRLKKEFRSIEQLAHPGLVRLHELGQDEEGPFFTMEAIEGTTLDGYYLAGTAGAPAPTGTTRKASGRDATTELPSAERAPSPVPAGPPPYRGERLAHVLPGILAALDALHGHGFVHGDLKPSNVMVSHAGEVKLLDFGILAERGASPALAGTAAYMAPEQISGDPLSPATDLYALGAMIFGLVAGHPVFSGTPQRMMKQHLAATPPSLAEACPEVPTALDEACRRLLAKDPAARPAIAELTTTLLPALGASPRPSIPPATARPRGLIGRGSLERELLALLTKAIDPDGRFVAVALTGCTGVGKTALASWLAKEAALRGAVVLRGRGRPTERVPFNVVDGVVDGLAGLIARDEDAIDLRIGEEVGIAAAAFPVLRRDGVPSSRLLPVTPGPVAGQRASRRREVFAALSAAFAKVAMRRGGLVVVIDDLQWADEDSLALLDHLCEDAPARVLVVATLRDDVGPCPAARWAEARAGLARLPVAPLGPDDVAEVIARTARALGTQTEARDVADLARRSAGRPFLAEVLGRAVASGQASGSGAAGDAEAALSALVDRAEDDGRALLAALLAGDEAPPLPVLAQVLGRPVGAVDDRVRLFERHGLVRRLPAPRGSGEARVDLYHSVVRTALAERLDAGTLAAAHRAWLDHLGEAAPPERTVRHLLGAGRGAEAAARALAAAPDLEERYAHGLAAELYAIALTHGAGDRRAVLHRLASALARGGRYREAARRWAELHALSEGDERVDAALHEAAALLGANDVARGLPRLDEALQEAGEPPLRGTGLAALWTALVFLSGPRRPARTKPAAPRRERVSTAPPLPPAHAERDARIGMLVSYFNPIAGVRFVLRARDGFDRAGAVEQAAWCDYVLAYSALFADPTRRRVPLSSRYAAAARARLGDRIPRTVEVRAFPLVIDGFAALRTGDLAAAEPLLDAALAELEAGGLAGTFAHMYPLFNRGEIDLARQDVVALGRTVRRMIGACRETGERALRCQTTLFEAYVYAFRGDLDQALGVLDALLVSWPDEPPTIQRYLIEMVTHGFSLHGTDPRTLRARFARTMEGQRRFRLTHSADAGLYAATAAIIEARAFLAGDPRASPRAVAHWADVARAAPPFGNTRALRALAYVEEARGRPERALALLAEAEKEAGSLGQVLDVALARHQRGKRLGGDEGRRLVEEGLAGIARCGAGAVHLEEDRV